MSFLLNLGLLLLGAKIGGEIAERFHYPSILGYIAAGLLFGPIHHIITPSGELTVFAELGALLLLFVAGIKEIRFNEIMRNTVGTAAVSFLGYLLPFVAVLYIATRVEVLVPGFTLGFNEMMIMAAALSTSSIITTVKALINLNKIETAGSRLLLGSSIVDSFIGLFVFTIVITFATVALPNVPKALGIIALTLAFFLIFYLAEQALPKIIARSRFLEVEEAQFTMVFVVMLGLVYFAQAIGLNGIIGAFFAGILISKTHLSESTFYEKVASLTYGIFVPIFFAWVGLMTTVFVPELIIFLIAAIAATNLVGAYIGSWMGGLKEQDALLVGVGMIPRGGIDLVIITAAKTLGLLEGATGELVFSSVVAVVMLSIVVTPILMYALFRPRIQ